MPELTVLVVHPDGRLCAETLPADPAKHLTTLYTLIGCHAVDLVAFDTIDMWIDDEGSINGSPINPYATAVAHRLAQPVQDYSGVAVFTGTGRATGDITPLSEDDIATIKAVVDTVPVRLRYGYNAGVPAGVTSAWGCRAIISTSGFLGAPTDRVSQVGPEADELAVYLAEHVGYRWHEEVTRQLHAGTIQLGGNREVVIHEDSKVIIKANPRSSYGYLYLCAYFHHSNPEVRS